MLKKVKNPFKTHGVIKWPLKLRTFLIGFFTFFKIKNTKHEFSRFFELLHTSLES